MAAAIEWATLVAYVVLAATALRVRLRQPSAASSWLALMFAVLAATGLLGRIDPDALSPGAQTAHLVTTTALGLSFPYLLFRFAGTFRAPSRLATWGGALVWAALSLTIPLLPSDGVLTSSAPGLLYVLIALAYWTGLSGWVVVRLWQRSGEQAAVARRRLRGMATAAVLLNVVILAAGLGGGDPAVMLAIQVLALVSAVLFMLGFSPPRIVRWLWRREDEQRLHAQEQRLGGAVDATEVAQIVVPAAARLFGGTVALYGQGGALLAGDHPTSVGAGLPHVPPGEVVAAGQMLHLGLRQGQLLVEASPYTPFFGQEEIGLLKGIGTAVDLALSRVQLSELERSARIQAEQTNAELEALLYGISHDLRTPLVALTGYVDILSEEDGPPEDQLFILERIRANTEYMDALIRDLLELSRIGRVEERTEAVDLRALALELGGEIERTHPPARVIVGDLPVVTMAATRARQLLTNLLQNAVRHAGRSDVTITVTSTEGDRETVISVADDGTGIPVEQRDRVFGIFERLQGRDDRRGGTGVGLAMCRKIVEGCGGRIWVGESPTHGTDVRFVLPVAPHGATLLLEAQQ